MGASGPCSRRASWRPTRVGPTSSTRSRRSSPTPRRTVARAYLRPHPSLARIAWYRRHEPAIAAAATRWLGWGELLLGRLGLPTVTDENTAGRWLAFDVVERRWMTRVLEPLGLDTGSALPSVVPVGTAIATLGPSVSLGLGPATVIVAGASDQVCTAIGAGLDEPGDIVVGSGTWENTTLVLEHPLGEAARQRGITWGRYVDERFAAMVMNPGGGSVVRWFREQVANGTREKLGGTPTSLLFLPHVAGLTAPWRDPHRRAPSSGLPCATGRQSSAAPSSRASPSSCASTSSR